MLKIYCAVFLLVLIGDAFGASSIWDWNCIGEGAAAKCVKKRKVDESGLTFTTCRLTCGPYGSLLPIPSSATLGSNVYRFIPSRIDHTLAECPTLGVCDLLEEAVVIMAENMKKYNPSYEDLGDAAWAGPWDPDVVDNVLSISLSVTSPEEYLTLSTDESYSLEVSLTTANRLDVTITAVSFFGARHALETMTQLADYDEDFNSYQMISSASIFDMPVYKYRGVIFDTARNYYPIKTLRKTLDGMSYNKLNTLHWHITDSQSFPMVLASLPNMVLFGAYDDKSVYTPQDIKDLVKYARVRGIRILPEFDAPGHVGHGWNWGAENGLGDLVVCLDQQPWSVYCAGPPCGQLNLANENIYTTLETLYKEMVESFSPVDLFHYGGDEVNLECWRNSSEIVDWMGANNNSLDDDSFYNQWSIFQDRAKQLVTQANNGTKVPGIIWTSSLTEEGRASEYLSPDDYIIQIWSTGYDPIIGDVLKTGFDVIFSNHDALYLDCGRQSWVSSGNNWCRYSGWQKIYDNDIRKLAFDQTNSTEYDAQILGAEAAIWSEQIDKHNVDSLLWPRASAMAERIWSNPATDYSSAFERMVSHRARLVARGLDAERLRPDWCAQNQRECDA